MLGFFTGYSEQPPSTWIGHNPRSSLSSADTKYPSGGHIHVLAAGVPARSIKSFRDCGFSRMNRSIALALAIICLGSPAAFTQQSASPAPTYIGRVTTCEGCHGSRGDSAGRSTPRLNGQKAECIIARLQDFLDSTKEAPQASYMVHVVKDRNSDAFMPRPLPET